MLGVSNAGKTRLAFEVLKETLPNWYAMVWRPDDKEPPATIKGKNLVVFIDDLQDHAPAEAFDPRGSVQTLDTRATALQKMLQTARSEAAAMIIVATCREEHEIRTRARMEALFDELEIVNVPLFPIQGVQAEEIKREFQQQAIQRARDWDGTLGSLVLGLTTKRQSYYELVTNRAPESIILRSMKLLLLGGIENHTETRVRTACARVFYRSDLEQDKTWYDSVQNLINLQFVTDELGENTLVIRKDSYFDLVITDYPAAINPKQWLRDLERLRDAFAAGHDQDGVFAISNTFFTEKRFLEALHGYDIMLNEDPDNALVLRNKASVLRSMERYAEALSTCDAALAALVRSPRFGNDIAVSVWRNKASAYRSLRRFAEAIDAYDHALAIEPDYAYGLNGKGKTLMLMNKYADALDYLDRAIDINPNFAYFWRNKGDCLSSLSRFEEAVKMYDEALVLEPNYTYALNGKGNALAELQRYDEALDAYNAALEINPLFSYSLEGASKALRVLGREDEAEAMEKRQRQVESDPRELDDASQRENRS